MAARIKKVLSNFRKLHYLQSRFALPHQDNINNVWASMKRILCYLSSIALFIKLTAGIAIAESPSSFFNQGFEKHKTGDLQSAVELYSKAIDNDPAFAMASLMRGITQQQLKKYPEAISDYSQVIMAGESSFKVVGYYNRGIVKNMVGDFASAIPDFSQAIVLDKKMAAAFFHRGIAKSKTGDLDGRLEDFRQAALLGETNAERWLNTYYPGWKQPPPAPAEPLPLPPTPATATTVPTASPT
jgi:tetratricopeptide (TPR) repeat protein